MIMLWLLVICTLYGELVTYIYVYVFVCVAYIYVFENYN